MRKISPFGRHTDADGIAYLKPELVHPPDRLVVLADLYRDKARTQLIAAGNDTTFGVIQLKAQNGGQFDSRIEINYQADAQGIELQLLPKLVVWRLGRLRTVWAEADRPSNPFIDLPADLAPIDRLPIIDCDVIGPDDLRYPYPAAPGAPDGANDIWLRRRHWVDGQLQKLRLLTKVPDFNQLLGEMLYFVQYGPPATPPAPVFVPPIKIADLDQIQATSGDQTWPQRLVIARLMELRQRDRQGDALMPEAAAVNKHDENGHDYRHLGHGHSTAKPKSFRTQLHARN
jgi:hypothetical protein